MKSSFIRYGIDDRPDLISLLLYGLQWLAVTGVSVIIMGKVIAGLHFVNPAAQIIYMQKLLFLTAITLTAQIFLGHGLPLVVGPAVILLVGIISSGHHDLNTIYSSIAIGGMFLTALCASGLFRHIAKLFTSRVVATILILIALTITPTILKLILSTPPSPHQVSVNLFFVLAMLLSMVAGNQLLRGVWRSTMLVWALIAGSVVWVIFFPTPDKINYINLPLFSSMLTNWTTSFNWDPGLVLSFLICFLALAINDLGSIESLGTLLRPNNMDRRLKRGMVVTGLSNVLAGFMGVIGLVNFSLTAGIIASNGNASRISFLPAAFCIALISFLPAIVGFIWNIPPVVIGTILLYIMSLQLAAGLMIAFGANGFIFQDAMIISIPVMLSVLVSFLPAEVVMTFPRILKPVAGNGFVVGTLSVLLLEHGLLRRKGNEKT
jgi:xanthine/uracil permease